GYCMMYRSLESRFTGGIEETSNIAVFDPVTPNGSISTDVDFPGSSMNSRTSDTGRLGFLMSISISSRALNDPETAVTSTLETPSLLPTVTSKSTVSSPCGPTSTVFRDGALTFTGPVVLIATVTCPMPGSFAKRVTGNLAFSSGPNTRG